jgi:hypothetical protein
LRRLKEEKNEIINCTEKASCDPRQGGHCSREKWGWLYFLRIKRENPPVYHSEIYERKIQVKLAEIWGGEDNDLEEKQGRWRHKTGRI